MKKLIVISLIGVMLASLVSCSGKGNEAMNITTGSTTAAVFTEAAASIAEAPAATVLTASKSKSSKSKTTKSKSKSKSKSKKAKPTVTTAPKKAKPTVTTAPKKDTKKKVIALTFDDGPNTDTTPLVLDKLEKYGIVASFFLCGQNINEDTKAVMERQVKLGCEINNHSWSHPNMYSMSKEDIKKQVEDTNKKINEMVGVTPMFFRPPFISVSANMYKYINLPFICGVGCNDWDANVSTEKRVKIIVDSIQSGEIILLHDASGNTKTVDALDEIIPKLQEQGYQFVTVSKLFELTDVEPDKENKIWTNVYW